MKPGVGISGGAHVALIGLAIFSGALFSGDETPPMNIAEVSLMTGTEFEAAMSAAPKFDPKLPPAPDTPDPGEERADVKIAEEDSAPSTADIPTPQDAPAKGKSVQRPPEEAPVAHIADVGTRTAGPAAPEAETLVAASEPSNDVAPVAEAVAAPAPAPRPAAPKVEESTPEPPPPPKAAEAAEKPKPEPEKKPEPKPAEKVAEADPLPVEDTPEEKPAEEVTPAPKLSPPPPTKPKAVAEAAKAEREERAAKQPETTGATKKAEAPKGSGSTRTVGQLSSRDKDSLRVGIKGFFSPPSGLSNADQLAVKLSIEVSESGKITAGPKVISPSGRLDAQHDALMRAGIRALKRAEAAGVFAKLPRDKYERWRLMNVTFTPREVQFL